MKSAVAVMPRDVSAKDLALGVYRRRLLLEGNFSGAMTVERVRGYLIKLVEALGLRSYGNPVVSQSARAVGKGESGGYEAFVPLVDSGLSAHFSTDTGFFSVLLYTGKGFDEDAAVAETRALLGVEGELATHSF